MVSELQGGRVSREAAKGNACGAFEPLMNAEIAVCLGAPFRSSGLPARVLFSGTLHRGLQTIMSRDREGAGRRFFRRG